MPLLPKCLSPVAVCFICFHPECCGLFQGLTEAKVCRGGHRRKQQVSTAGGRRQHCWRYWVRAAVPNNASHVLRISKFSKSSLTHSCCCCCSLLLMSALHRLPRLVLVAQRRRRPLTARELAIQVLGSVDACIQRRRNELARAMTARAAEQLATPC